MANPVWSTGTGKRIVELGTVTEGSYFEFPITAVDPNGGPVTYKFLAGTLPSGLRINSTGLIQGSPIITDPANQSRTFEFTVRASDQHGLISDKSFNITIANIVPPVITPRVTNLGQIFDGEFYSKQLEAIELNPYADLTWTLTSGTLPNGVTLSSSGLISGFVLPLTTFESDLQGYNRTPYEEFGYENSPNYQNNAYKFTVKVFDGANYDSLTYSLYVVAKGHYSADSTYNTIDNTFLTIDQDDKYVPIMLTPSQALPEVRSNSKFAFQFQAIDPNGAELTYNLGSTTGLAGFDQGGFDVAAFDQENLSVPPGLIMDTATGWLSGTVGRQTQALQTYRFSVFAYETNTPSRISAPVTYTMNILGDITNTITWTTSANLGIIDNGTISQLSVSAVNKSNRPLVYSLISEGSRLPQGLELQRSGLIVGRTTFEYFSLDGGTTTIDGVVSGFDNSYTFTVQATTTDGTASSQQSFTVLVNNFNTKPFENLYIKALATVDQRNTFLSIVNNNDIFPESLIYRPSDPWFGRARDIRSLFIAGVNPTTIDEYMSAMGTNTYNKRIEFGDVKTAQAVDANFNVKYEVVYLELKDPATYNGKSPANNRYDPVIGKTVYPNSFNNLTSVITNTTGYANRGAIPEWMSSPQENKKQLGFINAIVLAYTVPGASKLIAYRLKSNGIAFSNINFVADRYDLDNELTVNYNVAESAFNLGLETTFDRIKRSGTIVTSATYGIRGVEFDKINNKTVAQIQALGVIDGFPSVNSKSIFANGDTVIFLQQENFGAGAGLYDGWNNSGVLIPGYNEFVNSTKYSNGTAGFPSNPTVGQTALVNGVYYQYTIDYDNNGNILDTVWKVANLRANLWKINISSSNLVTLTPATFMRKIGSGSSASWVASSILPNDQVQINKGNTQIDTIVSYNAKLIPGNSVPAYSLVPTQLATSDNSTRFDNYGTRFLNDHDIYADPGSGDSWLKFPETGPLL